MSFIRNLTRQAFFPYLQHTYAGIERECLRVDAAGCLSQTEHPHTLGSSLTHRYITTDFSEALLELVTPVFRQTDALLSFLTQLHYFSCKNISGDEYLWPGSMPAMLAEHIPLARYGSAHMAQLKQIYRRGLHHRYGSPMQTISGIHYNFSLGMDFWQNYLSSEWAKTYRLDSVSDGYFHLMRNFRRHAWLLLYFFGASPIFDQSFMQRHPFFTHQAGNSDLLRIKPWGKRSYYVPDATSLRMSALGYRSPKQAMIRSCFNGLEQYVQTMRQALVLKCPQYQNIGLKDAQGGYQQLNTHLLQIENELYSIVRPKQITQEQERPLHALAARGVAYLEIRLLDNNPFIACGIDQQTIHWIRLFLLTCLLHPSPFIEEAECNAIEDFQEHIILQGRSERPEHQQQRCHKAQPFMESMLELAELLDHTPDALSSGSYAASWNKYHQQLQHPESTLSGQLLQALRQQKCDYLDLMFDYAHRYKDQLLQTPIIPKQQADLTAESVRSHQARQQLEQENSTDFEAFLQHYLHL